MNLSMLASIPVAAEVTGRVEGGWNFVIAAYTITWVTFALYTLSLWVRTRREES